MVALNPNISDYIMCYRLNMLKKNCRTKLKTKTQLSTSQKSQK